MAFAPSSAPSFDVYQALRALQLAPTKMTGNLQTNDHELALLKAIRREPVSSIGTYQVYTDTSREDRTVVFVHSPAADAPHKYILAHAESHLFVVATPVEWTFLHRNILSRIMAATALSAYCSGGGFVTVSSDGKLVVDGASTDFGAGDHVLAKAALTDAVRNSQAT